MRTLGMLKCRKEGCSLAEHCLHHIASQNNLQAIGTVIYHLQKCKASSWLNKRMSLCLGVRAFIHTLTVLN